ncbi:hypothetical protein BN2475_600070 [Paraburkholderia ribeironis]|uniref:Uncharacterized protein n=1 Tax=Paraburkholderia ribeironis TaxID=1247936 RepID=A0A1N7SF46_9BURK|nr:hypothetical protein BN2475_600070 [Paraburkholderia ribeironis]
MRKARVCGSSECQFSLIRYALPGAIVLVKAVGPAVGPMTAGEPATLFRSPRQRLSGGGRHEHKSPLRPLAGYRLYGAQSGAQSLIRCVDIALLVLTVARWPER